MSGIVGFINTNGAPVDQTLLQRMTDFMAFRGPDAQEIWCDGHVGLGHTMMRTTTESLHERQPCSLDGKVWITGDARVDGRAELIRKLEVKGRAGLKTATDAELILHAYHVWDEDCVQHLIGDFAFVLWDGWRQRLFGARDHFGVKPFYYAHVASHLIISNTLNCLRIHPGVSDALNDLAVGDFLLWGFNQDLATTSFADIRRLPPAHSLTWSGGSPHLGRYWTPPAGKQIRYKKARDYVEGFIERLRTAVDDRLRTQRTGVLMSGGLDSTAVAATAHDILSERSTNFDLRAYTVVFDKLIPDQERHYSGLVAQKLGIPIHYLTADDYKLYERWGEPELCTPEPLNEPFAAAVVNDQYRQVAAHCRVALSGYGADPALRGSSSYVPFLMKHLHFGQLLTDMYLQLISHGRLPPLGFRSRVKRWLNKCSWQSPYPVWFTRALEARLDLRARWEELNKEPPPVHPFRPEGYQLTTAPFWPKLFETYDAGVTSTPIEVRHPFFDLRLMIYMLAIPPIPWCINKHLLRVAMRHILPEPVRCRPKAPLAGDPILELLRHRDSHWVDDFNPTQELARYVNRDLIPRLTGKKDPNQMWINMHPLSLNYWLRHRSNYKP